MKWKLETEPNLVAMREWAKAITPVVALVAAMAAWLQYNLAGNAAQNQ
jgi:hypothetical protein